VLSVSATTRPPRPTETDRVDYLFVDDAEFDRMAEDGELIEWAEVFDGHRYGTPAGPVSAQLEEGNDVILEIDVDGARQIRAQMADAVLVLLEPPSMDELERRLRSRGTETDAGIAERLAKAEWELGQRSMFAWIITNDDLERASSQVAAIIEESRGEGSSAVDDDST
jgi:guanylate kinase